MPIYQHILLAADLLEDEDHPVTKKASELAVASGALLSLIHVVEFPYTYGMPYESPIMADWQLEIEKNAKMNVQALGKKLNIPVERQHLVNGQAKHLILETAEKIHADLIIVGSHGRHGIGLLLLGSTASGVLHGAKCDVLAVRVDNQ